MDKTVFYYPIAFITFGVVAGLIFYAFPGNRQYQIVGFLVALLVGHVVSEKAMRALY